MIADPISILITDDDANFRATMQGVLEPRGFRTVQAGDGQEAIEILHREPIHVLLLDMHMPRLTGLETLRQLRRFDRMLPCILLSAEADRHLMEQAAQEQAFAVLSKPVTRRIILQHVHTALEITYNWRLA